MRLGEVLRAQNGSMKGLDSKNQHAVKYPSLVEIKVNFSQFVCCSIMCGQLCGFFFSPNLRLTLRSAHIHTG